MLRADEVVQAKEMLCKLRAGQTPMPEALGELVYVMRYAAANIQRNPGMCDWLSWYIHQPWILADIRVKLDGMQAHNPWGGMWLVATEDVKRFLSTILDHHFWNDAAPYWKNDQGRYGDSAGEDVLIKLVAYACFGKN